jgi:hypothetical protein
LTVGVEPAPARDVCATIGNGWLLRWSVN